MVLVSSIYSNLLISESFVVPPKKKQPKITAQDCCQEILLEMHSNARIFQHMGAIQAIELGWAQDILEDDKNALFNRASQEQLQKFMHSKQELKAIREEYERALKQEREFLKQLEKEVFTKNTK